MIFEKDYLLSLGLPDECETEDGAEGKIHLDQIVDNRRWSIDHHLVFSLPGQPEGEAWATTYSVGATEQQDERPWEHEDTIECTPVRLVERTVKVWEAVKE